VPRSCVVTRSAASSQPSDTALMKRAAATERTCAQCRFSSQRLRVAYWLASCNVCLAALLRCAAARQATGARRPVGLEIPIIGCGFSKSLSKSYSLVRIIFQVRCCSTSLLLSLTHHLQPFGVAKGQERCLRRRQSWRSRTVREARYLMYFNLAPPPSELGLQKFNQLPRHLSTTHHSPRPR